MPDEREAPVEKNDRVSDPNEPAPGSDDDAKPAPTRGGSNVPNAGRDPDEERNE
jgi:hypothetical protein